MVTSGKTLLYNGYLPQNKHASRKLRLIEEVYAEISTDPLPDGRYYLTLDMGGEDLAEGCEFNLPQVKYKFKKPWTNNINFS